MRKLFKVLMEFRFKQLLGKRAALFLLNRKLPEMAGPGVDLGRITDLELDRESKTMTFTITRAEQESKVSVRGYRVVRQQDGSYLGWQAIDCTGPAAANFRRTFSGLHRIPVPERHVRLLESVLTAG